jgi:hypothetical protein
MTNKSELNGFGKLLALANSNEYKDNATVQSILSTINYQKSFVDMHRTLNINPYEGFYKALDGEKGYSLFGLDEHNVMQAFRLHTRFSILKEMLILLDSVLVSMGEKSQLD